MNPNDAITISPFYQGLRGVAVVCAAFAGITALLLLAAGYQAYIVLPRQQAAFEVMQEQARAKSADAAMQERLASFDRQIRGNQFRQQHFIRKGSLFLVITLLASAAAFLTVGSGQKPQPDVPQPVEPAQLQMRRSQQAQVAVMTVAACIGGAGLYLSLQSRPVQESQPASPPQAAAAPADWADRAKGQWPSFRGIWGDGVCTVADIPTQWDEKAGKGIIFKSPVALPGHSSPIVWADRIFISGADEKTQKLFCYSAADGRLLWEQVILPPAAAGRQAPEIMEDTGYAACTPAANDTYVCAIFATGDIACFDHSGKKMWDKAFGVPESSYGYAASLAVFGDWVIVQMDVGFEVGKSKLYAIDMASGKEIWAANRPVPNSWTSPTVVKTDKGYQILTSGNPYLIGYDAPTGRELWRAECLGGDVAPTQILAGGLAIAVEPYNKIPAVRIDNAGGDVSKTALAWEASGNIPDISSPLSDGTRLWTLSTDGTLDCFSIADGSKVYSQSLDAETHASPCLVGDKLYILTRDGQMIIASAGAEYKEIQRAAIEEKCYASPAFAAGRIYLRSVSHLYCIGENK